MIPVVKKGFDLGAYFLPVHLVVKHIDMYFVLKIGGLEEVSTSWHEFLERPDNRRNWVCHTRKPIWIGDVGALVCEIGIEDVFAFEVDRFVRCRSFRHWISSFLLIAPARDRAFAVFRWRTLPERSEEHT